MEVTPKLPLTLEERIPLGTELRITASWDEFLEWLSKCEYRIEYNAGEIISFMDYASEEHEILAANIAYLLRTVLEDRYKIAGSNLALSFPGFDKKYYNADCTVIEGKSERMIKALRRDRNKTSA